MSKYITEAGNYHSKYITGRSKSMMQDDVAVVVNAKGDVHFDTLEIWDCGLPLVHTGGNLFIDKLKLQDFSADAFNSYGNLFINELEVSYYYDYKYSNDYHVDALGQFFNFTGSCSNVYIGKIKAEIVGSKVQGMMLSEANKYSNFSIGSEGADISLDYPYAFVANTLEDSYINVGNNGLKIKEVKDSLYNTNNIWIERPEGVLIYHKEGDIVL